MPETIFFDSAGGASGDMILGGLLGLYGNRRDLCEMLRNILPDAKFDIVHKRKTGCSIFGYETLVKIDNSPDNTNCSHEHRKLKDIKNIINRSELPDNVKKIADKVFLRLAEAEADVHGCDISEVHFHEVGAVDSIIDIVGSCYLLGKLNIKSVGVSTLPLGRGTVKCAHGVIPVPAPATVKLLSEGKIPVEMTSEPFELVTPTAAALLTVWKEEFPFASARDFIIHRAVNSFGHRELTHRPNLLRLIFMGNNSCGNDIPKEYCIVLQTNIDDISPEIIGALYDTLFANGALDVYTQPVYMKKNRQGIMLTVICHEEKKNLLRDLIFRETTTLGIRETRVLRHCLERQYEEVDTKFGKIHVKKGFINGEVVTCSPEIEDCISLAKQHNVPMKKIIGELYG